MADGSGDGVGFPEGENAGETCHVKKRESVMRSFRVVGVVLLLLCQAACAVNEKSYWPVTDSEMYWNRPGFAVKAPSESWSRNPLNEKNPDSISFSRGEGAVWGGMMDKPVYMNFARVVAVGIRLQGAAIDRKDKVVLTATLRKYLDLLSHWPTKVTDSSYDNSLGLECLKYSGSAKKKRHPIPGGEVKELPVTGYFCLHPDSDRYGVVMESHNYSTSAGKIPFVDEQANHFFTSLRFSPISNTTSRPN
jgi:hypothetical protein